jgi:asparagine synthase (glutamine-hydrolysing)
MCGICIQWGDTTSFSTCLDKIKARGPDSSSQFLVSNIAVGFNRLRIQGSEESDQPYKVTNGVVVCNGEIFNSIELNLEVPPGSSDCAVIPAMIEKGMNLNELSRQLDGDFAIVYVDITNQVIHASRDPYGVRPLYYVRTDSCCSLVSELKAAPPNPLYIKAIQPGTSVSILMDGTVLSETVWHQVPWLKNPVFSNKTYVIAALRTAMEEAVAKRMTTVRDIGACLSGGLDSSLVAALAARILKKKGLQLHTYSIGMEGSPDLAHARLVADYIGSIHHERVITSEEALASIPAVIRAIESCDITTVRASVGNYLLGQFIATVTPTVKVVLNGDGADEALGGYLYMRSAPNDVAFEAETTRLLTEIHLYDVARSERSMAAHGLESRSPFLDRQLVSVIRGIPTELLRTGGLEKHILREAFYFPLDDVLPTKVIWRRKEAFSDGISRAENSWFEMARAEGLRQSPDDKAPEASWYRRLFLTNFSEIALPVTTPAMWMPRFVNATDPSARTLIDYKTI